jgi:tetratricopeptide (TPR) repeat protein
MDLSACDLTARLTGYQTAALGLGRRKALDSPDVGVLVLHSLEGSAGGTISLKTLAAPKKAKEAYEKAGKEFTKEKPNYSKVAKELEKAVKIYPEFASAWHLLGEIHLKQNDRSAAAEAFEEAKAADPAYVNPYLSLALMALEEERWQEAADLCGQTLEMNPQLTKAHYYNALAYVSLGHLDDAESSALLVLEHKQAQIYPLTYYVLGFADSQRGNFPSAAARFRSLLEIQPNLPLARKLEEELALWQKQGLIQ